MAQVSIIIPYYKTYELTTLLLDNLCSQKTDEVEILLIDDGCKEDRLDKYPITIIHKENGGVSSSRNKGLDEATGEYITFIDSDDNVAPNYIEKILDKIKTSVFDYCLFSWEMHGKYNETVIIEDMPPHWNCSIWNCIYKRELIGSTRFNIKKTIAEDREFNRLVRTGVKENIPDVLYYYFSGREDSLTWKYCKGLIKIGVEDKMRIRVKTQLIVFRSFLSKLGGIETAIYNLCNELKDTYDIIFVYDTADACQLVRLKKLVKCIQFHEQHFECDVFLYYGFNPTNIENYVEANKFVQQICCDCEVLDFRYTKTPKVTHFFADSEASARAFLKTHPQIKECGTLHNLFNEDIIPKKMPIRIMTASRLSKEKGYDRIKAMAHRMNELGYPFTWEVFTNEQPNEDIPNLIFRSSRLNVQDFMFGIDYGTQLSDTESWGCTITEFLMHQVPTIATDFASATEQIEDGVNGFILKKDLSNMDEVIEKMYNNKLKFEYVPKYSVKEWTDLIGDLGGKKQQHLQEDTDLIYTVRATRKFDDTTVIENGMMKKRNKDDVWEVSEERYNALVDANGAEFVSFREVEKVKK